jgi:hypothetical protein
MGWPVLADAISAITRQKEPTVRGGCDDAAICTALVTLAPLVGSWIDDAGTESFASSAHAASGLAACCAAHGAEAVASQRPASAASPTERLRFSANAFVMSLSLVFCNCAESDGYRFIFFRQAAKSTFVCGSVGG